MERSHALDGLRGFAATAVIFYHAILHNDAGMIERVLFRPIQSLGSFYDMLLKLALQIQHGETAVYVFFVLSGTVLQLSLARRGDALAFTRARLLRLYPPLVACLVLFYALSLLGLPGYPHFTPQAFIENASLWKISMHGPSTTIQVEVMAIPFILAAWLARRHFGLPALMIGIVYATLALDNPSLVFGLPNMHAYLLAFMAGMIVAEPALRPLMQKVPPSSWWLALAALVFCRMFHPQGSMPALICMTLCAAFLVAGLLHGERGSLHRLMEGRLAQALGKVSFSLYLLNVPIACVVWAVTDQFAWPKEHVLEAGILTGFVSLLVTWPVAWLSERYIEQPSIAMARIRVGKIARPT